MARIAFIGMGKMGLGMAGRLLAAGHELNVYNRTPAKAAPLVERGARLCASPAGGLPGSEEGGISMVADDAASREVVVGGRCGFWLAAPREFMGTPGQGRVRNRVLHSVSRLGRGVGPRGHKESRASLHRCACYGVT